MGIYYTYHTGYGFLLPLNKFALPAEWDDRELWYDGIIDKEISGSGMIAIFGGCQWTGDHVWGFMAEETVTTMSKDTSNVMIEVRDVDPVVIGNLFDISSRVKRPKARIGWTMWVDRL